MAELIHKNLESMLPELEELERTGIFTRQEIRQIVRRRRNLEYKLKRRPPQKADYLQAIKYEMNLDALRKHRKKKRGLVSTRRDAEFGIQSRIHTLFRRALKKFKSDLKLWLQYIEFSKQNNNPISLGKTFARALAIHPHHPGLWVMAAKFEFEDRKNISATRTLLQQGLRANTQSKHLWIEYFRMELLHADKVKKRRSVLGLDVDEDEQAASYTDEFLANKTASLVYQQAIKAIPGDVEFRASFLPVYQLFEGTDAGQEEVYGSLQRDFPSHPLSWDILARRPWVGMASSTLTESQIADLERRSEGIFREGLDGAEDGASAMWEKFIVWCVERSSDQDYTESLQRKAITRLLGVYKEACHCDQLSEAMFEQYVHTLHCLGLTRESLAVAEKATTVHPSSLPLWLLRVRTVSSSSSLDFAALGELCCEGVQQVPRELSLPLWRLWLEVGVAGRASDEEIEAVYEEGLGCGVRLTRDALTTDFLDWAMITGGLKKARRLYKRLLEMPPVAYSLYDRCISVEKAAEKPSMKRLRELYEAAVADYGSDHPDLWLDFIHCESALKGGRLDNVGRLHWRAVKGLRPELTADFVARYSLLQAVKA